MITVYYDGKCGLCSREIAFYKRIAPKDRFDWVDITKTPERIEAIGVSFADAMRALHVRDDHCRLQTGVSAFVTIWRAIPLFRPLSLVVGLPLINTVARFAYDRFADWRFKRQDHCAL